MLFFGRITAPKCSVCFNGTGYFGIDFLWHALRLSENFIDCSFSV